MNDAHSKIDELYQAVFDRLVSLGERIGVSTEQAEDMAQTAFMRLVERADSIRLDNRTEVTAWLNTVVRNLAKDYFRDKKPQADNTNDELVYDIQAPEHQSPQRKLVAREELRQALLKLTPSQQEALVWIAEGFTTQEISEGTGVKAATVDVHAWRGRQKLRR